MELCRWGIERHRKLDQQTEVDLMARIIVTTEHAERDGAPVLLDERVCSDHLSDDHSAAQLVERLCWAIDDAERSERAERSS